MSSETASISESIVKAFTDIDPKNFLFRDMRKFAPSIPVSDRIFTAIQYASAYTHQHAPTTQWQARTVRILTSVVYETSYLLNTFVALGESMMSGFLGSLGTTLWIAMRVSHIGEKTQWPFVGGRMIDTLEKYTVQSLSYSAHSGLVVFTQMVYMSLRIFPGFHTVHTTLHEAMRLGSVFAVQAVAGSAIIYAKAREEGRKDVDVFSSAVLSAGFTTATQFPGAFTHTLKGIYQDISYVYGDLVDTSISAVPGFDDFLEKYPVHRATIRNFSFGGLMTADYQKALKKMFSDMLVHSGLFAVSDGSSGMEIALDERTKAEKDYRNELQKIVKASVIEIYNDKVLSLAFGTTDEEVKENFESDANSIVAIACYAQLNEILKETVVCPTAFESKDLKPYNERNAKIVAAKKLYDTLSDDDQVVLTQKLLRGSSLDLTTRGLLNVKTIQELYVSISALAGELHQGKLMSQVMITPTAEETLSYQNLFAKSMQEAIKEL